MKKIPYAALAFICCSSAFATHLRSGQIKAIQYSSGLTVAVTILVFTNTINTSVEFGGDGTALLDLGDGTIIEVPVVHNTLRLDLGEGVAQASFSINHTYQHDGRYLISYSEPNRNIGVLNMDNSVSTLFYLETSISLSPGVLYRTPDPLLSPVFVCSIQKQLTRSLTCVDSTGSNLWYELVVPKSSRDVKVQNYRYPEDFSINSYTGVISWDTKFKHAYIPGEYAFAVKVSQLDELNNVIGYMVMDFQIILIDGSILDNTIEDNKVGDDNGRIYAPENKSVELKIVASAKDVDKISVYVNSELMANSALPIQMSDSTNDNGKLFKIARLTLDNEAPLTRDIPYSICVRTTFKMGNNYLVKDATYLFYTKEIKPYAPVIAGTEESLIKGIEVYPSPFHNRLFVDHKNKKPIHIEIMNLTGRLIFDGRSSAEGLDLTTSEAGLYLVITKQDGKIAVTKVIKE